MLDVVLAPDDHERMANLCGQFDEHIRQIEDRLGLKIRNRGNRFELAGSEAATNRGAMVLKALFAATGSEQLDPERVHLTIVEHAHPDNVPADGAGLPDAPGGVARSAVRPRSRGDSGADKLVLHARRRDVRPRGPNQIAYVRALRERDLTFGIGPAGTGKTYLAVAAAVEALGADAVRRIVLVRPAVEAGERLGFLPGDMAQKIDPYLRPMYDALYEMMGFERVGKLIDRHVIEVAPLAFMRGRTLNESFVILDEAQNTTPEQMKMFLTRIGFGSRAVVTGDVTQTDLPPGKLSGLNHASRVLGNVAGVTFVNFGPQDVVRHPLVQRIVAAYADDDAKRRDGEPR